MTLLPSASILAIRLYDRRNNRCYDSDNTNNFGGDSMSDILRDQEFYDALKKGNDVLDSSTLDIEQQLRVDEAMVDIHNLHTQAALNGCAEEFYQLMEVCTDTHRDAADMTFREMGVRVNMLNNFVRKLESKTHGIMQRLRMLETEI